MHYESSPLNYDFSNIREGNLKFPGWRHQMETFSAFLALCVGNSSVPGEFPAQRPVMRSFDVFFDMRPNKRLSKQSWGWWFETLSCSLWRHCNAASYVHLQGKPPVSWILHTEGWVYILLCYRPGVRVTNTKVLKKTFSTMFGSDWLMLKHQPITTKHSAKSFYFLKPFSFSQHLMKQLKERKIGRWN